MNILFLTLSDFDSYNKRNIYCDLLCEFIRNGHEVYCISPAERRTGVETHFRENRHLLKLKIGNTQKTNIIEKGISTLMIEPQFIAAVKKYFADVKFDLVLYSTPPITLAKTVQYVKKRDGAKTYLLLKDIFPQNAVDIGMMQKTGLKGLLYRFFRNKEKKLYALSDRIGCMSPANVEFVVKHNPQVDAGIVEVCPNSVEPMDLSVSARERAAMREKYGIPQDKRVFVYGGNLGKPQGIPFLMECLKACAEDEKAYFLVVGDGTEYGKLEAFFQQEQLPNAKLLRRLPKEDYDRLVAACDVGLIFLDHRFTIPNFPSRLLSYMQARLPVLCATDPNTDIGRIARDNGFGWWCESTSAADFCSLVNRAEQADLTAMGDNAWAYLLKEYTVQAGYQIITESIKEESK